MGYYCWTCGWNEADLEGTLDPRTAMCRWCRDHYRPARPPPGDLGYHAQPQPLAVEIHEADAI
jgi:hypothetical protein